MRFAFFEVSVNEPRRVSRFDAPRRAMAISTASATAGSAPESWPPRLARARLLARNTRPSSEFAEVVQLDYVRRRQPRDLSRLAPEDRAERGGGTPRLRPSHLHGSSTELERAPLRTTAPVALLAELAPEPYGRPGELRRVTPASCPPRQSAPRSPWPPAQWCSARRRPQRLAPPSCTPANSPTRPSRSRAATADASLSRAPHCLRLFPLPPSR